MTAATVNVGGLGLAAANPGSWGQKLRARVERPGSDNKIFNLFLRDSIKQGGSGATERFFNVSTDSAAPRYVKSVLEQESSLVRATTVPTNWPTASGNPSGSGDPMEDDASSTSFGTDDGSNGDALTDNSISDPSMEANKQGLWALEKADLFNLLCIPPLTRDGDLGSQTRNAAAKYCADRRAVFVVDPLRGWATHTTAMSGVDDTTNFTVRPEQERRALLSLRARTRSETRQPTRGIRAVRRGRRHHGPHRCNARGLEGARRPRRHLERRRPTERAN